MIDRQFIIDELAKSVNIEKDKVKVAVLSDAKKVHMFVLKDMDEDEINLENIRKHIRSNGYRMDIFAAENIKVTKELTLDYGNI